MLRAANSLIFVLEVFWVSDGVDMVYGTCGGKREGKWHPESF